MERGWCCRAGAGMAGAVIPKRSDPKAQRSQSTARGGGHRSHAEDEEVLLPFVPKVLWGLINECL